MLVRTPLRGLTLRWFGNHGCTECRLTASEFSGNTPAEQVETEKLVDARGDAADRAHRGVVRCTEGLGGTATAGEVPPVS